ncbi:MAG: SurA N-terminal domain-containing protein [Spirochaetes bacterium]|nr:SurA N-terminal domain-containing protein [Spirochaetota bacterium]
MFNTKLPLQKIFAYFFIGFISFLLIIFFVGTDIISSFGGRSVDPNVVAVVNGQKINRVDYFRYSQRFREQDIQGKEMMILDNLIAEILFYQRAKQMGIEPTEGRVMRFIRGYFKDKNTGTFDEETFKDYLQKTRTSIADFYRNTYKEVVSDEFRRLIQMGFALTQSDIRTEYAFLQSNCQVQYAFIDMEEYRKRVSASVTVTEQELKAAMEKNRERFSDEATNRRVTKEKLEEEKFSATASSLLEKINAMAKKGESFAQAAALLGARTGVTPVFTLGEPVKQGTAGDPVLTQLEKAPNFIDECIFTAPQKTSRVLVTPGGIAVITPLQLQLAAGEPSDSDYNRISDRLSRVIFDSAYNRMIGSLREEAKIVKKLKTD